MARTARARAVVSSQAGHTGSRSIADNACPRVACGAGGGRNVVADSVFTGVDGAWVSVVAGHAYAGIRANSAKAVAALAIAVD